MIRLPPISTRTDTLFPYTRASDLDVAVAGDVLVEHLPVGVGVEPAAHVQPLHHHDAAGVGRVDRATHHDSGPVGGLDLGREAPASIGAELALDGVRGDRKSVV